MSRRADLPSAEDVQNAIKHLSKAAGKPPTVLALARHLGLANTTFRRKLTRKTDELRRNNHELTEHLELALANIQRLSLENHQLRQHLEATSNVAHIGR